MQKIGMMRSFMKILAVAAFMVGCEVPTAPPGIPPPPIDPDLRKDTLATPKLSLGVGIETGIMSLSWTSDGHLAFFTLQADYTPDFRGPREVYYGPDRYYELGHASDYPYTLYYRVRAETGLERSEWSNIVMFPPDDGVSGNESK